MAVIETHDEVSIIEIEEERITVGVEPMGVLYTTDGIVGGGPMNHDVTVGLANWVLEDLELADGSLQSIVGTPDQIDIDATDAQNPIISLNPVVLSALSGADPTALIGLTPVPGTSDTFIRADGAPALDQNIEPVWTGNHVFEGDVDFTGNATVDGSPIITGDTVPESADPSSLIGLVAIDGTAETWMRSDAAPALDQSITPRWTSQHTFDVSPLLGENPTTAMGAATKQYVDDVAAGLSPKSGVKAATTANITLSGLQTIDGVDVAANNRVLVKNQTNPAQNGIYLANAGAWTRSTDMNAWAEVPGAYVFAQEGTINADVAWVCTANEGGTLGTTPITWTQFAGAGTYTNGFGLLLTGTQFSLDETAAPNWTGLHAFNNAPTIEGVNARDAALFNAGLLSVARGGTGAGTLTGYVKGNGTAVMTASPTIPYADISGVPEIVVDHGELTGLADNDHPQYMLKDINSGPSVTTGGVITDPMDGSINISAGTGFIRTSNNPNAPVVDISWGNTSIGPLVDQQVNYVYLDYNGGTPTISISTEEVGGYDKFVIGIVARDGMMVHRTQGGVPSGNISRQTSRRNFLIHGVQRASGLITSEIPTRRLQVTGGTLFAGLNEYTLATLNTSTGSTFKNYYRDGSGGWNTQTAQTQVNNLNYDDGSGTLATLSNGRYGVYWLFRTTHDTMNIVLGRGNYTQAQAQAAALPADLPVNAQKWHSVFVAKIIILKNAVVFTSIENPFMDFIGISPASDHGTLVGLGDDDHPQYHTDARGDARYAPLVHTHSAADITTGTLLVARGGTGAATLTGYVKGNGTGAMTASATIPYTDITGAPPAGGSPGGATTYVQFNNAGVFGGDADFTWDQSANRLNVGSLATAGIVGAPDAASASAAGAALQIRAGVGGSSSGNGGALSLFSGASPNGNGGALTLTTGTGGGAGAPGGDLSVTVGTGGPSAGPGGAITINSGTGGAGGGAGGNILVTAGAGNTTGTGGLITLTTGLSPSGTGGYLRIRTGTTSAVQRLAILSTGEWSLGTNLTSYGTAGQVLTSAGAGGPPTWQNAGGSLDLAANYPWTGQHTFANSSGRGPLLRVGSGNYRTLDFGNSADARRAFVGYSDAAGSVSLGLAFGAAGSETEKVFLNTVGVGTNVSTLNFGNATDNPAYNFLGTGVLKKNGVDVVTNSGTWAISVTGNAATATSSAYSQYWWSTSHSGTYYLRNDWDGSYWMLTSNHPSGVRVAYANTAGAGAGTFTAPAFNASSSRAIKQITGFPKDPHETIMKLEPVLYRLLEGPSYEQIGLISEEVCTICPWLSFDGKSVAYDRVAMLLLVAYQRSHGKQHSIQRLAA